MVWEYLLPGRRILKAMARRGRPRSLSDEDIASNTWESRWNFQITSVVEYPLLLCICRESRAFALKNGHFVFFNIEDKEPGMWWGPEDVLLFNEEWSNALHLDSLKDLSGLEHVQHIALDFEQSRYTAFVYGISEDTGTTASEIGQPVVLLCLAFPRARNSCSEDERHFIPRFFANVREITFLYDKLWQYSPSWSGRGLPVRRDFCNARDTGRVVTFRGGSPMVVARR